MMAHRRTEHHFGGDAALRTEGAVVGTESRSALGEVSSLALVAITHQRAPLELLERVNVGTDASATVCGSLIGRAGVSEAVVVSTCNRTELYLHGPAPDTDFALRTLAIHCRASLDLFDGCVVTMWGADAALHLLRVTAGLESRVVGEVEVFGQIRSAIAAATASGSAGSYLTNLFRFATAAGRRAQRTIDHALIPSLPRLALDAARPNRVDPVGITVVLGSGAMAATTTRELAVRQLDYWVCARTPERAVRLARSADHVVAFEDLVAVLERANVVVCATGARIPLLRVADLVSVMARRAGRPLTIIDLSLPRNVEPAARHLPGIRLLDLDDLIADSSELQIRRREEIVGDELRRYQAWLAGRVVGHLIAQLRDSVQTACRATLERSNDSAMSSEMLTATARTMANKLLHGPMVTIKNLIAAGDESTAFAVLASYGISTESTAPLQRVDVAMQEAS